MSARKLAAPLAFVALICCVISMAAQINAVQRTVDLLWSEFTTSCPTRLLAAHATAADLGLNEALAGASRQQLIADAARVPVLSASEWKACR